MKKRTKLFRTAVFVIFAAAIVSGINPRLAYADTSQPESSAILPPILISEDAESTLADVIILHISSDLTVDRQPLQTILQRLKERGGIPAFYPKDQNSAQQLSSFLTTAGVEIGYVMSDDVSVLKFLRKNHPSLQGIADYRNRSVSEEEKINNTRKIDLDAIKNDASAALARVVLIKSGSAAKRNVEYLQHRLITVWVEEGTDGNSLEPYYSITSGANGILTTNPERIETALSEFQGNPVLLRNPAVVGYRGLPTLAPENSVKGLEQAMKEGVEAVEISTYLSKDGEPVVTNEANLLQMAGKDENVWDLTVEQLKTFRIIAGNTSSMANCRISMLRSFLSTVRGTDEMLFLEVGDENPNIIPLCAEYISDLDLLGQINLFSSSKDQIYRMQEALPELSSGYLFSLPQSEGEKMLSPEELSQIIYKEVTPLNAAVCCADLGTETLAFNTYLQKLGLTSWLRTYSTAADAETAYFFGAGGITTYEAEKFTDIPINILPEEETLQLNTDALNATKPVVTIQTRAGSIQNKHPEIIILSGEDCVEVTGNSIKGVKYGSAVIMYKYTVKLPGSGQEFDLYSQPVFVSVNTNSMVYIFLGAAAVILLLLILCIIIICVKKRKNKLVK